MAGGKGTRGRPYTDYFPKAMTPVLGRPLIDHIVEYLSAYTFIDGTIIISDYTGLGGQIKNYYRNGPQDITFIQDSQSGTGGDLLHAEGALGNDGEFVLWFVDNLCAIDLAGMRDTFIKKKSAACIATRTRRREETGFASVKDDIVERFVEKPTVDLPMAECLGIYVCGMEVLHRIKEKGGEVNLSYDILQGLSEEGMVSAFDIGYAGWIDAESPAALERNADAVRDIIREMESSTRARTGLSRPQAA